MPPSSPLRCGEIGLSGRWNILANDAKWTADSGKSENFSLVENTIWRVVSGLSQLRVTAELGGTVSQPTLAVSSNLDDAIASRLRALVGEELAKGELKARAAVDRLVEAKIGPARARVDQFKTQAAAQTWSQQEPVGWSTDPARGAAEALWRWADGGDQVAEDLGWVQRRSGVRVSGCQVLGARIRGSV